MADQRNHRDDNTIVKAAELKENLRVFVQHSKMVSDSVKKEQQQDGWTFRLVSVMGVAYLIIFAMAFSLTSLNAPSELVKAFINATEMERSGEPLSDSKIESLFGLLSAVVALGALLGSVLADPVADCFGRKYALFIATAVGGCGSVIMGLCRTAKSYEMIFVGRVLCGFSLGSGFALAPPYIMEMCQPNQKGTASMANILTQSFAFFTAEVFGYVELMGNEELWNYLLGFPAILCGVQMLLLPFLCPQNPRYLLMKKNDEAGAIKALQVIRGKEDVKEDIKQLQDEVAESETDAQVSMRQLFTTPILRRPLLVAVVLSLQQNWCGMNGILMFSNSLFEDAGVTGPAARYATSAVGIIFIVGNIITALLMRRFGRKTLFVAGNIGLAVCCAVFSVTKIFQDEADFMKYIVVAVALLIMVCFCVGPVGVYWVILGELFPHSARGSGFGVSIVCIFVGFFTHCYAFPAMQDTLSSYTFFVFAGGDVALVIFCIFFMPETKDKTFADLAKSWTKAEVQSVAAGEPRRNMSFTIENAYSGYPSGNENGASSENYIKPQTSQASKTHEKGIASITRL